jgi:hypothetical protein
MMVTQRVTLLGKCNEPVGKSERRDEMHAAVDYPHLTIC